MLNVSSSWSPGGRLPLTTLMRKLLPLHGPEVQVGPPVPYIPAANDMPTSPGPTSQTPLLQAKFVVIRVGGGGGGGGLAAAADVAAPRVAATSVPVISRALSGERMTASPGRGNGRCPCWPEAVRAPGGASGDTY